MKWDVVPNSKDKGGLEIGNLDAFNLALFYKWKWHFLHEVDSL